MSLTLTISDAADNTGGTATVSGSSAGTISIQRATVTQSSNGTFAEVTTRSGDGTVALTGTGYYRWQAVEGATTTTATYQPLTEEGDSIHHRCGVMLADRITALSLPGFTSGVFVRHGGALTNVDFPAVVLFVAGVAETAQGGGNATDYFDLPFAVTVIDRVPWKTDNLAQRLLHVRERIRKAVHMNAPWDYRVPEFLFASFEAGPVINPNEPVPDQRESLGTIRCRVRQRRGVS